MKFKEKITKDAIRLKLSKAAGCDIGEVYPQLLITPLFLFDVPVAFVQTREKTVVGLYHGKTDEIAHEHDSLFFDILFMNGDLNREDRRLMATFSAS